MTDRELTGDEAQRALSEAMRRIQGTVPAPEGPAQEETDSRSLNEKSDELDAIYAVCLRAGMAEPSTALDYVSSVFCAFKRLTSKRESWAVTVERDGESVVTLSSRDMAGRDLIDGDEDTIRTAARHLLSFLGDPSPFFAGRPSVVEHEPGAVSSSPASVATGAGADVKEAERLLGVIWNNLTTEARSRLYLSEGVGLDPIIHLLRLAAPVPLPDAAPSAYPIRAHVEGCCNALSVPVDLCACGGRDFTPDPPGASSASPAAKGADEWLRK